MHPGPARPVLAALGLDHAIEDVSPSAFERLGIGSRQVNFGHPKVEHGLQDRLHLGGKELGGLGLVARAQTFTFARGGLEGVVDAGAADKAMGWLHSNLSGLRNYQRPNRPG